MYKDRQDTRLQKIKIKPLNFYQLNKDLDVIAMAMESKGINAPAQWDNNFIKQIKKLQELIHFYNDTVLKTVGIRYFGLDVYEAYQCLVRMQDDLLDLVQYINSFTQNTDDILLERKYLTGRTWSIDFFEIEQILSQDKEKSMRIYLSHFELAENK